MTATNNQPGGLEPAGYVRRGGRASARPFTLWLFVIACIAVPATAHAQVWLPFKGEGHLSTIFQGIKFSGHFDTDGSKLKGCQPSQAFLGVTEFEYGVTNKLSVSARLPYIASKFTGTEADPCTADSHELYEELLLNHPELASLDTGSYYSTFQDFNFTAHYSLFERGLAVTPFIGVIIPSHHYRTVGEASPGQDRRALDIGVAAGRLLDPLIPDGYVQAQYTYSVVQSLYGVRLNRSHAEIEAGYSVTPIVSVRGLLDWSHTHGGLTFAEALDLGFGVNGQPGIPELFLDHDRLLRSRYWHVGGGVSVALTDDIGFDAAVIAFPAGADSHYGVGMTMGLTWKILSPRLPSQSTGTR